MSTGVIAILAVIVLPLVIGLIAILTEHQRRMAEIIHRAQDSAEANRIQALEQKVGDLTSLIQQQTILLDTIAGRAGSSSLDTNRIEARIGE